VAFLSGRIALLFAAVGLSALALGCGGGGVSQAVECKDYLACNMALGNSNSSLDASYGASGTCWSTTQAAADSCKAACVSADSSLKSSMATAYGMHSECKH